VNKIDYLDNRLLGSKSITIKSNKEAFASSDKKRQDNLSNYPALNNNGFKTPRQRFHLMVPVDYLN
jgi:hypothetical protein